MSKNKPNIEGIAEKISKNKTEALVYDRFDLADNALELESEKEPQEKVIRKSYAITKSDLENIDHIKDSFLDHKIVVPDSYIIRLSLKIAASLTIDTLIHEMKEMPRRIVGRPKKR